MSFSDWEVCKLGDIAEVQNGYAFKSEEFATKGIPIIKIKNIVNSKINLDDVSYFDGEISEKLKQFKISKDDILISMTGSHINQIESAVGKVGRYQFGYPSLLNQRVAKVFTIKKEISDNLFLYYFLNRFETQFELASSASGSANQANISPFQIKNLEFSLPPLPTQKRIASILSALDDKIELNRQTNQTLEAIAQTLFKEMCLPKSDVLPEGWSIEPLDEIGEFLNGIALQKFPAQNEKDFLPVIKIRELKNGITNSSDKASRNIPEKYVIKNGDLLFSWSGTLEVDFWCNGEGALNQHLFKVDPKSYPKWFLYLLIQYHIENFRKIAEDKTTTMGHIQRRHLSEALCFIPNNFIEIDKLMSPIIKSIIKNSIEIQTLINLRDSLLPKLMKGEIEITSL